MGDAIMKMRELKIEPEPKSVIIAADGANSHGTPAVCLNVGYLDTNVWVGCHLTKSKVRKLHKWLGVWLQKHA